MIVQRVVPGAVFEAYAPSLFATGLVGTIGVRLRDGEGADAIARTTDDIAEDIAGSGIYRASLTAPDLAGEYWLIWDDDDDTYSPPGLLVVTSSVAAAAAPAGRDLCALEDVQRYVPGYEPDDDTDATLQALITKTSIDVYRSTGREFTVRDAEPTRLFDLGAFERETREVDIGDLATAAGVTVEVQDHDGTVLETVDAAAWVALPRSRDAWLPVTSLAFPAGLSASAALTGPLLAVTGVWGFPEVPVNVREAVAALTILRYLTNVADSGTAFSDAAENLNLAALLKSSNETLAGYRVPVIA